MTDLNLPDLHSISDTDAELLCGTLRTELIESVSKTGGHLASNLGAVELTVAIHRVFNTESDRVVFDVGHQCYCHKILTGRREMMDTLRSLGGIAGFPKPSESVHDAFIAGHASNSVSVALGMARARSMLNENYHILALIGDGALSGGLSYEGLSDAGQSGEQMIVILNDNGMSITRSVGGVSQHLAKQRLKPQYLSLKKGYRKAMAVLPGGKYIYRFTHRLKKAIKDVFLPGSIFENMGFTFLGPVDGHDVKQLTRLLGYAKELDGPVLLHVRTVKGKGYAPAENNPDKFHGVSAFHVSDGTSLKKSGQSFSAAFGDALCELAENNNRICAITAAMQSGTGLEGFAKKFPDRFFDVGIAEGHAVAMAAGMAKQGTVPVFAVYSTFLQRAYDMLIHDVAIQNLHVVFCVDRAGLVGEDGETHHGTFDPAFLDTIPGMTVLCPSNYSELRAMLHRAIYEISGPVAVRYPRGSEDAGFTEDFSHGASVCLKKGEDITLVGYGTMIKTLLEVSERVEEKGINAEIVKINTVTPIDLQVIAESCSRTGRLMVAEDSVSMNCVGKRIVFGLAEIGECPNVTVLQNLGDGFVTHGSVSQLRKLYGLDVDALSSKVEEVCARG